jgi:ribosomal 50S subunit-recycling heat shock protein
MRLDKYLKNSRLVKRRTLAKEFADAGRVLINGKIAKSATSVSTGDKLELTYGTKILTVEILNIKEIVKKDEATEMFNVISEKPRPKTETDSDTELNSLRDL